MCIIIGILVSKGELFNLRVYVLMYTVQCARALCNRVQAWLNK